MNYHNINTADIMNGEGLRVVLWLSGCSHHCKGCQNPQTWDTESGILFDDLAEDELFRELNKDYISGITLTGGDPLHEANLDGVLKLVNKFRLSCPDKTIWLYTGYIWDQLFNHGVYTDKDHAGLKRRNIIKQCDVVVDGKYINSKRDVTLKWRGSSNQRVIDVKKSILKGEVVLWNN